MRRRASGWVRQNTSLFIVRSRPARGAILISEFIALLVVIVGVIALLRAVPLGFGE